MIICQSFSLRDPRMRACMDSVISMIPYLLLVDETLDASAASTAALVEEHWSWRAGAAGTQAGGSEARHTSTAS
jgi:hypothetical protein